MTTPNKGDTGIYQIRCVPSKKIYIGSASWCFLGRWDRHRVLLRGGRHYNAYMQRSWNHYGEAAFEFTVIELCAPDDCIDREQVWLDLKKPFQPYGFNICRHADSTRGRVVSEKVRKAIGDRLRGRKLSTEHRAKLAGLRIGYVHTEETKQKIGAGRTGKYHSAESKNKVSVTKRAASPINQEIADWIRRVYVPGHPEFSQNAMARRLKVSRIVVQNVLNGKTWNDDRYAVEASPVLTSVAGT